ncbi:MAG: nucleotidyltransferase domain-containing protein, partial [Porphyrobacter sp.]|nr:nucleotidyltransferase domain-containing protein [Porphyrobacter sp.]
DSDYDVRFVYVRRRDWYLQLVPGRDVIEQPIVDDIDLNGWDIRKTLGLLLKSNAVVSEWLSSPIRYRPDDPAAAAFVTLADALFDPRGVAHHYANLGRHAAERWLDRQEAVRVKKYFYALRPALAIRALRGNPGRRPAMNLQELMVEAEVPAALAGIIDELVAIKRQTREQGLINRIPALDALIKDELSRASEVPERLPTTAALEAANAFFLELVRE